MPVRMTPDIPDLAGNWLDVSDKWTRAEFKRLLDADGAETLAITRAKVVGCHIETDGGAIDDPAGLTEDALDHVDMRLLGFLGAAVLTAVTHLRSLGFRSARPSFVGTEATGTSAPA